jgi:hypothetical protein
VAVAKSTIGSSPISIAVLIGLLLAGLAKSQSPITLSVPATMDIYRAGAYNDGSTHQRKRPWHLARTRPPGVSVTSLHFHGSAPSTVQS